jgi:hypothetical protein
MPARTGYDRELVFEEAEFYARRHGTVRLELDCREMVISVATDQATSPCGRCGQRDAALRFVVGDRRLCRVCIRTRAA